MGEITQQIQVKMRGLQQTFGDETNQGTQTAGLSLGAVELAKKVENVILEVLYATERKELKALQTILPVRIIHPLPKTFLLLARYLTLLSVIHELLVLDCHCTKRDVYYRFPSLFENYPMASGSLNTLSCFLKVPRNSLRIVASERGVVAGNLSFWEGELQVNCNDEKGGRSIVPSIEMTDRYSTTCDFLLVVEKYSIFLELVSENFHHKHNCIVVTGRGYPDVGTRELVAKLSSRIPSFILTDLDPHGMDIFLVYSRGSAAMQYSTNLSSKSLRWVGLHCGDIDEKISEKAKIPFSLADTHKASSSGELNLQVLRFTFSSFRINALIRWFESQDQVST